MEPQISYTGGAPDPISGIPSVGGDQPHNNMPPFQVVQFIIRVQ
jgi:microcystin-dependent protein